MPQGKKNYIGINVRKDVLRPFKEKTVTYKKDIKVDLNNWR